MDDSEEDKQGESDDDDDLVLLVVATNLGFQLCCYYRGWRKLCLVIYLDNLISTFFSTIS